MKKGAGVLLYSYDNDANLCVLLGKRLNNPGKGQWGIPGGGMENSDENDPQNTAIRECYEETKIIIEKPLTQIDRLHFPNLEWFTYMYEIPLEKRKLFIDEVEQSNWFNVNNLPTPLVSKINEQIDMIIKLLK